MQKPREEAYSETMRNLGVMVSPKANAVVVHSELTPARIDELERAIATYPNFQTACQACFVSTLTVMSWVRRGTQPDADPIYAEFAARFLKADADHAQSCYQEFRALARKNMGSAGHVLRYMNSRWNLEDTHGGTGALATGSDAKAKRSDNLEKLLQHPTPRLAHMLRMTGWVRHPAWGTKAWGQVVDTTAEVAESAIVKPSE